MYLYTRNPVKLCHQQEINKSHALRIGIFMFLQKVFNLAQSLQADMVQDF